jgi:hypothetical protein
MVMKLVIDFGELGKVLLKGGWWKKGRWVGAVLRRLLGFVAFVCVTVEGAYVNDCRRLGLCAVGTGG